MLLIDAIRRHNDTFLRAISTSSSSSSPLLSLVIAAASDSDEHTRKFAAFAIGNAGKFQFSNHNDKALTPPFQRFTRTRFIRRCIGALGFGWGSKGLGFQKSHALQLQAAVLPMVACLGDESDKVWALGLLLLLLHC